MLSVAAGTGTRRLTLGGGDVSAADLMVDTPRQARPEINRVVSVGWRPTN